MGWGKSDQRGWVGGGGGGAIKLDQKSNWPEVVSLFLVQGEKWRGGGRK